MRFPGDPRHPFLQGSLSLMLLGLASCGNGTNPGDGPVSFSIIAGDLQTAPAGTELPQTLVARVTDSEGRPVQGQVVNFRVTVGEGSVFAGSGSSNGQGVVQERWTLGYSYADTQRVEARAVDSDTGDPIVFGVFRAIAGPELTGRVTVIDGQGQSAPAGERVAVRPTVAVDGEFGGPVPEAEVTFTVTSGGGSVSAATVRSDSAGVASVEWTLGPVPGANTLQASRPGYATGTFIATGN
jgi:hypothetical protein